MKAHEWVREVEQPVDGGTEEDASAFGSQNEEEKEGGEQQGVKNTEGAGGKEQDHGSVEVCGAHCRGTGKGQTVGHGDACLRVSRLFICHQSVAWPK